MKLLAQTNFSNFVMVDLTHKTNPYGFNLVFVATLNKNKEAILL
jgi:hypothetical protein